MAFIAKADTVMAAASEDVAAVAVDRYDGFGSATAVAIASLF